MLLKKAHMQTKWSKQRLARGWNYMDLFLEEATICLSLCVAPILLLFPSCVLIRFCPDSRDWTHWRTSLFVFPGFSLISYLSLLNPLPTVETSKATLLSMMITSKLDCFMCSLFPCGSSMDATLEMGGGSKGWLETTNCNFCGISAVPLVRKKPKRRRIRHTWHWSSDLCHLDQR